MLGASACQNEDPARARKPPASATDAAAVRPELDAISRAEYARDATALPREAATSRNLDVRRQSARALSRIADDEASESLSRRLADEDPEVVAWAAYGLGYTCRGREAQTVRALVARAAFLDAAPRSDTARFALDPRDAVSDALSRCGTAEAEATLRAWLDGARPLAESAALALARLSARKRRLDDATKIALLDAAAKSVPGALAAFAHVEMPSESGKKRLLELCRSEIRARTPGVTFAIRALAAAGPDAIPVLGDALADETRSAPERSAAALELTRLGPEGQAALATALGKIVHFDRAPDERWISADFAPVSAALGGLEEPGRTSAALVRLADIPVPKNAPPFLVRRLVMLRCGAAAILAGKTARSPRLLACDPDPRGRAGALALLRVLDRGTLDAARREVWKRLEESEDPAVRRAALAIAPRHPELAPLDDVIAEALASTAPGVVAQAARVLAEMPRPSDEGTESPSDARGARDPSRTVVDALARALDSERPPDQIETRVALMDAAAALGTLSLKSRIERYCGSPNVTLRRRAEASLRALGGASPSCAARKRAPPEPPPPGREPSPVTLTFVTDAGRLGMTLDPGIAPFAVARVTDLARSGFYDGVSIHRVVPGFVVQFGDRGGDGYGGSGKPPLPCETSPLEFRASSVGIALGGRDTGSSQLFVTLAEQPQLYGDYPLVGWADPEWSTLVEGDRILRVEVRE